MNIFDVLYARQTGKTRPRAKITDNLLGLALAGGGYEEKTIDFTPVITVSDAKAGAVIDYQCKITAVQTGTNPSPDNICPITGWTGAQITRAGKNLFDADSVTFVNGYLISATGEITSNSAYAYSSTYISVNGNTYYEFFGQIVNSSTYNGVAFYDAEKAFISRFQPARGENAKFTTPENCAYIRFNANQGALRVRTVSLYENPTIYSVSWQSEAGTVYGGILDATTGTLTVDYGIRTYDGTEEGWRANSLGNGYYIPLGSNDYDLEKPLICNCLLGMNAGSSSGMSVNSIRMNGAKTNLLCRLDTTTDFPTVDDWKDFLTQNPMTVLFPLAEPITYTLTPTEIALLAGANTLWADTGDSSMTYLAKR